MADGAPPPPTRPRLDFLEAVRGVAALLVLADHSFEGFVPRSKYVIHHVLNGGEMGVIAFFLVSGFVIPMTLERSGSQLRFWVNRVFRIYPLYLTVFFTAALLGVAGVEPFTTGLRVEGLPRLFAVHLPIVQDFTGGTNFVGGAWTLLVEFVFYAGFSIAFALGLHRRPLVLLVLATLPVIGLSLAGIALHRPIPIGRPCLLLWAFGGFCFYRHWQGLITTRALVVVAIATVAVAEFGYWQNAGYYTRSDFTFACTALSALAAAALFMIAYAARERFAAVRGAAIFVGSITYSVYLLHPLPSAVVRQLGWPAWACLLAIPAITVPLAMLTFRFIERPGMALGRRLGARLTAQASS